MREKVLWITRTGVMLALLIAVQAVTQSFGQQLLTGTCVNTMLVLAVLLCGLSSGLTVAVISPVAAFLLGIAPNLITVIPIMLGNACYVTVMHLMLGKSLKPFWKQPLALIAAAGLKFGILYLLVVKVICGVASGALLGQKLGDVVVLATAMLEKLPAMFTWPQLITALAGGAAALFVLPIQQKAMRRRQTN